METDDKTLVERILKGETDEFRHLMRRHGGTLLAFIEGITHSREEAEDILQEAFVCAYRSLHQYNIKTASFATWLHHIAYHQALRQRKKRRLPAFSWDEDERLLATVTEWDTNEEAIEATEERMKLLDNAISHLPDYDRTLLQLYYEKDLPLKDIAYILDSEAGILASRLRRIRDKLRKTLTHHKK
ncbi:MAG: RNA polymerase sigma factor [Bacteroidaceae bacterium]|nr:RNA polymerase sigma factor [Bacteroidaceae bacterium]